MVAFVGYNSLNFATKEDYECIAQYYSLQSWLLTTCHTMLMNELTDVDTPLSLLPCSESLCWNQWMPLATA